MSRIVIISTAWDREALTDEEEHYLCIMYPYGNEDCGQLPEHGKTSQLPPPLPATEAIKAAESF